MTSKLKETQLRRRDLQSRAFSLAQIRPYPGSQIQIVFLAKFQLFIKIKSNRL